MSIQLPFRNLEPTFCAGLLDDPLLLVRVRPTGRNLLFDCGQLHHLAKRNLTRLAALFISHTHMDHWMGIDTVIRHLHASPQTLDIFGPPGIAAKLQHKLAAYDWNLAEAHWGSFRVHEIYPDRIERCLFSGPADFARQELKGELRKNLIIYRSSHLRVRAATCTHRVPSLIFRIDERPTFQLDREKLTQLGLVPGPWLGELKRRFFAREKGTDELRVLRRSAEKIVEERINGLDELTRQLQRPQAQASLGYVSDVGYTAENRSIIAELMQDVSLLLCECTFLAAAQEKARSSSHLCTEDVNQLLAALRPRYFLPMHLSKTYGRRTGELYRELIPPPGTEILRIPPQQTPRPRLATEFTWHVDAGD